MLNEIFQKLAPTSQPVPNIQHLRVGCLIALDTLMRTLMNSGTVSAFYKEHSDHLYAVGEAMVKDPQMEGEIAALCLKLYVETVQTYVKKLIDFKAHSSIYAIMNADKFILSLVDQIMQIPAPQENVACIFYLRPKHMFHELINEAKSKCVDILRSLVDAGFYKDPPKGGPKQLKWYPRILELSSLIIQGGYILSTSGTTAKSIKTPVESCGYFMARTSRMMDFYTIYQPVYQEVFINFCLPNLVLTEKEAEDFNSNESEFVRYSTDLALTQKSKTLKCFALQIVDNFCEKIDGVMSFVSCGVMGLVDSILDKKSEAEMLRSYPTIEPLLKSKFIQAHATSPETVLDVCLLLLSSLSIFLASRTDLMYACWLMFQGRIQELAQEAYRCAHWTLESDQVSVHTALLSDDESNVRNQARRVITLV